MRHHPMHWIAGGALAASVAVASLIGPPPIRPARESGGAQFAEMYAICTYRGASGRKYMGMSAGDCDSACDQAYRKCVDSGDTPCEKTGCTATN